MKYIKIKFTLGLDCEAYQVIDNMVVVSYVDLQCNPLELPEVTESYVIDGEILEYCGDVPPTTTTTTTTIAVIVEEIIPEII